MGDAAVRVWDRILGDFGHTGVIRRLDTDVLRIYCDAVVRYGEASRLLESSGPLIRGRDGALVRNPLNQVVRDQAKLVQSLAGELGLTPAARTGLTWQQAPASQGSALSRARERRLRSVG
jgi:P27 family predicted phage terminase small subunit